MKKVFTLLLFITVSSFISVYAQSSAKSLLWKVSGNGLEQDSYLLGTIHLLCPDQLVVTDKITNALNETERLVLELDFDDPGLMIAIQKGMFMENGETINDYLSEEELNMVSNFFTEDMKMPFQQLSRIKPFFLSSMTAIYYMDCTTPASWELKLVELAGKSNKEVLGLETAEDQLSFIDNISLEDQVDMLIMNIEERDESREMTTKMVEGYLKEDLEILQEVIDEFMSDEYSDMNENLLVSRNMNWIPIIRDMMKETSSLFAFGAGHLTGDQGVIALLKEAGYTVEPVF